VAGGVHSAAAVTDGEEGGIIEAMVLIIIIIMLMKVMTIVTIGLMSVEASRISSMRRSR
jgi:hypothetical protein